ncbi:MAG: hypothetical protein LC722_08680, partial [Actinobacteria bacterium]|nr:hypothetical protein [Actinomycetota bacterium]
MAACLLSATMIWALTAPVPGSNGIREGASAEGLEGLEAEDERFGPEDPYLFKRSSTSNFPSMARLARIRGQAMD